MWEMFRRNKVLNPTDYERLKQLEFDFYDARDRLDRLEIQHRKLSGRYYQQFGSGEVPTPPPESAKLSRDELRKLAGIRAGQPAPHK